MVIQPRGASAVWRLLTALMAVVLLAAACGSEDSSESATDETDDASSADSADDAPADDDADEANAADDEADEADGAGDSGDRVEIRWFVGLGTGSQEEQIDAQDAVVDAFNASQDQITLVVEYIDNSTASDVLATQIAAGNAPDIIGPVGLEGANAFAGQYADMDPLVEAAGFDLTVYGDAADVYRNADGALEGIPYAVFPSALFYNIDLFDEAGLPYPPSAYGPGGVTTYGEGTEFEGTWDWAKLQEIAEILSVDSSGVDASSPDYNKDDIIQFGFAHQWTTNTTSLGTSFGAGSIIGEDGSADIPDPWVESYEWYHNLVHEVGAAPNAAQTGSDLLAGNVFNSGNVAMASTHLWYTCCLFDGDGNAREFWDVAALPSNDGVVTSKLHGDTFRIHVDSEHQQEAFTVLEYFFDEAALDLLTTYGAMPARDDIRDDYFAALDETFPQGVNWEVLIAGLDYPDVPNHQAAFPNYLEANARLLELESPLLEDADLDIAAAIEALEADIDAIWGAG